MQKQDPETTSRYLLTAPRGGRVPAAFNQSVADAVRRFHRSIPGYQPTRLVRLRALARALGVAEVLVKDESTRFGLNAFKALGSSYAVARRLADRLGRDPVQLDFGDLRRGVAQLGLGAMTLVTATDGNHGRGVAWVAEQLGLSARIFMPQGSASSRVANIRAHGATVEVTNLNYDDTVRLAARMARENGWQRIQDTACDDYDDVPGWIMQGYLTMGLEACEQMAALNRWPTHVVVQAGVGSFAAAMVAYLTGELNDRLPRFIVVEPTRAACMLASATAGDGQPRGVSGNLNTIMAGLACGEPSPLAWDLLWQFACAYVSCDDDVAAAGMRILANPLPGDDRVVSGESAAVGIGLLAQMGRQPAMAALKAALGIGPASTFLVFSTEGATDPEHYREILWYGKYPLTASPSVIWGPA